MVNPVTTVILDALVGKGIGEICENHFDSASQNHCAHFVSHVLGLRLGLTCGGMTFRPPSRGASIRCDEVFNRLSQRGPWASAPALTNGLLLFATSSSNVINNQMANVPRKHVGNIFGGAVYNFGNSDHKVRKEATIEAFRSRMGHAYGDPQIGLFYAVPR